MSEIKEPDENEESNTNYQALFVLGITFMGAGTALMVTNPGMAGLAAIGLIFMIVGLVNRDKWKSA